MRAFVEGALAGLGIAVPVGAIAVLIVAAWQLVLAGAGALLHHRLPERALLATALFGNVLIAALAVRLALGA